LRRAHVRGICGRLASNWDGDALSAQNRERLSVIGHNEFMPLPSNEEFYRIKKLPPYVFAVINELRDKARAAGIDIVDMGMGNPDGPSPERVVEKVIEE